MVFTKLEDGCLAQSRQKQTDRPQGIPILIQARPYKHRIYCGNNYNPNKKSVNNKAKVKFLIKKQHTQEGSDTHMYTQDLKILIFCS